MRTHIKFGVQLLFLLFGMVSSNAGARGHLRQIWKLRLGDIIQNADSKPTAASIFGLSFSPDGQRILVVYGPTWKEESVIILRTADPKTNVRRLGINPPSYEYEASSNRSIVWATPEHIIVNRSLLNLSNGSSCTLPPGGYDLLSVPNQIIGNDLKYYDLNCQCVGQIDHSDSWHIIDVSAERSVFFVRQEVIRDKRLVQADNFAIDAKGQTIPFKVPIVPVSRFAQSGKTICAVQGRRWNWNVACWDIDTGKEVAVSRKYNNLDIQPALYAPRIVLSNYGRTFDFINLRWAVGSLRKRIIWDIQTGQEIVSWQPKIEETIIGTSEFRQVVRKPYRFAISPDGEYIIEGGAGELILRKIEPGQLGRH
jgi:hypothetical protein